MFRSSLNRILDWAEQALAPIEDEWQVGEDGADASPPSPHPHRRALRWERDRRPGAIPPRPAHCISPVRRQRESRTREDSAR